MSSEIASFYATIGADVSGFSNGLDKVKSGMSGLTTGFSQLTDATSTAMKAGGLALAAFGGAIVATGIQFDAMKEQANVAFTTMLGSGQAAQGMLNELQAFAAKTPFEFPDLIRASQRLMAMGFASQDVLPTLTAVGDAVAALGGTAETVDRVTTALGQMNAKGKTSAEEMMQLTEAGIPAWQMLADKIGVTIPEAMAQVTKGAVSSGVAIEAITTGIEARFGGMMEAQSHTFNGIISNIKDGFGQLSGQIMAPFFEMAKGGLEKISAGVTAANTALQNGKGIWAAFQALLAELIPQKMLDQFNHFIEIIQNAYTAISAIVAPIVKAIGEFVEWQDVAMAMGVVIVATIASIVASFAPMIATFVAITAAVAAMRHAWETDFMGIRTITQNALRKISDWFFETSGIWQGTWEKTIAKLQNMLQIFWERKVYFLIRGYLILIAQDTPIYLEAMRKKWDGWVDTVGNTISNWTGTIVSYFTNLKDRIISTFHAWTDPLIRDITHWAEGIKGKFDWMVQWIIGDFGYWTRLIDYIKDTWQKLVDWWGDHIQPFVDKGKEMMQGLWDGAKDIWQRFSDWWGGLWRQLTGTVDVKMRIGSPSKVMEDRGMWIGEGLARGVENSLPMVNDAMNAMSAAAMGGGDYGYSMAGGSSTPQATSTARIEELLTILIQELRAKSMTANVSVSGGGMGLGDLVGMKAGLR